MFVVKAEHQTDFKESAEDAEVGEAYQHELQHSNLADS
jgi:hypothetical protein